MICLHRRVNGRPGQTCGAGAQDEAAMAEHLQREHGMAPAAAERCARTFAVVQPPVVAASAMERPRGGYRCRTCHQPGHNSRTCGRV